MSEPGDKVFVTHEMHLHASTIQRRNNDGTVVVIDTLGQEWIAEAVCVYKLNRQLPAPTPSTPSLGPTPEQTPELTSAPNGLKHPASTESSDLFEVEKPKWFAVSKLKRRRTK